jgi:hypothetical protein
MKEVKGKRGKREGFMGYERRGKKGKMWKREGIYERMR